MKNDFKFSFSPKKLIPALCSLIKDLAMAKYKDTFIIQPVKNVKFFIMEDAIQTKITFLPNMIVKRNVVVS